MVERVSQISTEDYILMGEGNAAAMGIEIVSSSLDSETNGGVIAAINYMSWRAAVSVSENCHSQWLCLRCHSNSSTQGRLSHPWA